MDITRLTSSECKDIASKMTRAECVDELLELGAFLESLKGRRMKGIMRANWRWRRIYSWVAMLKRIDD